MKRTSTFLGLILLISNFSLGQNSVEKNRQLGVQDHLEAWKKESKNDSQHSSPQVFGKPAKTSFLQSTLANKQKLDSVVAQTWNDTISQLKKTFKIEYKYNSEGHQIQDNSFQWGGNKWINYYLNIYTNDANGNRIQTIENHWDRSQWTEDYKSENMVDSSGNTTQSIIYNRNGDQLGVPGKI